MPGMPLASILRKFAEQFDEVPLKPRNILPLILTVKKAVPESAYNLREEFGMCMLK